jgi:hypothetical protein
VQIEHVEEVKNRRKDVISLGGENKKINRVKNQIESRFKKKKIF